MDGTHVSAGPVLVIDHDRLFKELLTTFFVEFLALFFPKLAGPLDADSIEFLSQEIFADLLDGDLLIADLLVKARFKSEEAFFLIHVEHQSSAPPDFARRFFRYQLALVSKYGLPVYPIVVYSHATPKKKQPNVYRIGFPDGEVLRFTYRVVQLNRLPWRRFVRTANPVASALTAKMKVAKRDRPRVKMECLRLMVTLKLDPARMRLIGTFVDAYLRLNAAEERGFNRAVDGANLAPRQKETIVEFVTSWEQRGIEKGIEQGIEQGLEQGLERGIEQGIEQGINQERQETLSVLRAVLLDILASRFGPPADAVVKQVNHVTSVDELRTLAHRALSAVSITDLGLTPKASKARRPSR